MQIAQELRSLGVQISDTSMSYRGKSYPLRDVESVVYTATKTSHSVNFIPTGSSFDAKCRVFMDHGQSVTITSGSGRVFAGDGSKAIAPVWLFSEVVSELTFEQRLDRYERSFEERNYIEIGSFQIHKDGTVFCRARRIGSLVGDARELGLSAFSLSLKSGPFSRAEIPIDVDRDCVLSLLRSRFRLVWDGQKIRERRTDQRRRFFEGVITLGAKISKADGAVSPEEVREFKHYFRPEEFPVSDVAALFKAALSDQRSIYDCAVQVAASIKDETLLDHVIVGLVAIAAVDGVIHEGERRAIFEIGRAFGLGEAAVQQLLHVHSSRANSEGRGKRHQSRSERAEDAVKHLRVLGLSPGATVAEVKAAYRKLTLAFHPDLLRSKGVPDELVKVAEGSLTQLNLSYHWLKENGYGSV
ncbi:MAG: TerB family tellurite resistance protein [Hyphomonadaceae bacterium]|nr:TerB family tellurite resistance protein [Hyphomonadaceae bacterium]